MEQLESKAIMVLSRRLMPFDRGKLIVEESVMKQRSMRCKKISATVEGSDEFGVCSVVLMEEVIFVGFEPEKMKQLAYGGAVTKNFLWTEETYDCSCRHPFLWMSGVGLEKSSAGVGLSMRTNGSFGLGWLAVQSSRLPLNSKKKTSLNAPLALRLLFDRNIKMAAVNFSVVVAVLSTFFFLNGAESQFLCKSTSCRGDSSVTVRFPFRLKNSQDHRCGYQPDFDLFCNNRRQTILQLPNAGNFAVLFIDYKSQYLWINDPDRCFPNRLLIGSFDLQNSPFTFYYRSEPYTFLTFSYSVESLPFDRVRKVKCMSGVNYSVITVPNRDVAMMNAFLPSQCEVIARRKVPMTEMEVEEGMAVKWSEPECGNYEEQGGDCGFESNSSAQIQCFNLPMSGNSKGAKYSLFICVGIPGLLFLIGLVCFVCSKLKALTRPNRPMANPSLLMGRHRPTSSVAGLDGLKIESFPKTLLGESRRLPKPNDITCAICLSEYQSKEMIRTIPDCGHFFHANCIDEWLKLNATCPVCRNSPEGSSDASTSSWSISMCIR